MPADGARCSLGFLYRKVNAIVIYGDWKRGASFLLGLDGIGVDYFRALRYQFLIFQDLTT